MPAQNLQHRPIHFWLRHTALLLCAAIAPATAQVQWNATSSTEAQNNPVRVNSQLNRICRVTSGGNTFVGTERNGACHYADSAINEFSSDYTVGTGLGKWEGSGLSGAPVVGNLNGVPVQACRASVDGTYYAGYTRGNPAFCQIAAPSGFVARASYEQLYDFNFTGPFQIRSLESCMAFGPVDSGVAQRRIGLQFEPCLGEAGFHWKLQQIGGQIRVEHDGTPGSCISTNFPSTPGPAILVPCSTAMLFAMTWDTDTTYRFRNAASGALIRRFSGGFQVGDPVAASTFGGTSSLEVLTLEEASRRFSVLSYNIMMLPRILFPALQHEGRGQLIPDALNREGLLADVVAFQEAFDGAGRRSLSTNMRFPYGYRWVTNVPDHSLRDYAIEQAVGLPSLTFGEVSFLTNGGAYLMSRWPIEFSATHKFTNSSNDGITETTGADSLAAKGVSYARINKLGRRYHVFTTHLQAGSPDDEGQVRAAQLQEIAAFANARLLGSGPDDGIIYTGDFNYDMESDPVGYNLILTTLRAAFVNAPRPVGATLPGQPNRWTVDPLSNEITATRGGGFSFLDYVFVGESGAKVDRAKYNINQPKHSQEYEIDPDPIFKRFADALGSRQGIIDTTDLSDHGAVLGRFVFQPRPASVPPVELPKLHEVSFITSSGGMAFDGNVNVDGGLADTPRTYSWPDNVQRTITAPDLLPGPEGFRYSFDSWGQSQPQSFQLTPFGAVTYDARYDRQPLLSADIVPFEAGTVSNLGYYRRGSIVTVATTAKPGFRFLRLETPNAGREANQTIRMGDQPVKLRAVFESTGLPRLSLSTDGTRRYLPNDVVQLGLRMANSSANGAVNPRMSRVLSVQVLSGTGNFELHKGLSANFLTIGPNTTSLYIAPLQIFWPVTAQRIRIMVEITADGGYVTTQTLNLIR